MKITDRKTLKTVPFQDIRIGECFIIPSDNRILMRMATHYYDADDADNAVDLVTGIQYHFEDDEEVIPITTEIIITG